MGGGQVGRYMIYDEVGSRARKGLGVIRKVETETGLASSSLGELARGQA